MNYSVIMKRLNHKIFLLLVAVITAAGARAQYDPVFTHFWMMETQFNPAAAGNTDMLRAVGVYNAQLSGYDNAPSTMLASVDMPLFFVGPQHGVGAYFMNDEAGFFSLKNVALQYAYHRKIGASAFSIGLQADLLNESFDGSKVDLDESGDEAFSSGSIDGSKLDMSAGLAWAWRDLRLSASVKHITAPTILLGEKNEMKIKRSYYFTAGYNIKLRNPLFTIHPDLFCVYDGTDYKAYLHGRVQYDDLNGKMLFGGLSYSPSTSAAIILGGSFHGLVISYSYEAFTSGVGIGNGNHEVVLSYQTRLNLYKKGRNRHKSVRLL